MTRIYLLLSLFCACATPASASPAADWYFIYPGTEQGPPPGTTLVKMLTMTNDRDKSVRTFNLMLSEQGTIAGMYMDLAFGNTGNVFLANEIESRSGVVLAEAMGKSAVILQGIFDKATLEGKFHLDYLNNALLGSYRRCEFFLRRSKGQAGWYVQNAYTGRKIENIRVTSWTFGVASIEGMCPADRQ